MDFSILTYNLSNPTILFFLLGIVAVWVKSDLQVPESSFKFISLYLLLSIGFKGGQELAHGEINNEVMWTLAFGMALAIIVPVYVFYIARIRLNAYDSAAVAAAYGSVSAVTFVSAIAFVEFQGLKSGGHMVAVMALMEAPAIVMGLIMLNFAGVKTEGQRWSSIIKHSFTNGSVLLIFGSLIIGMITDAKQAEGIRPFTNDIFKGFLAIFLLEMGMSTAKRLSSLRKYGWFVLTLGVVVPLVNGLAVAWLSGFVTHDVANRLILAVLAASASYIAVPAAMRLAVPQADPGLYVPMALGITFPLNITLGMPLYFYIVQHTFAA